MQHPTSRSGSTRLLLAAVLGVLALLLTLWGLGTLGTGDPVAGAPVGARPAEPGAAEPSLDATGAAGEERLALPADTVARTTGGPGPGVRLPGAGGLQGAVVARGTGAGVAGATVSLWALPPASLDLFDRVLRLMGRSDRATGAEAVATTVTDADGLFAFEGVRPGRYFADARGDFWVPEAPHTVLLTESGGERETLFVRPGGAIAGRLVDEGGRGVEGARVSAFHGIGVMLTAARAGELCFAETRSEDGGRFRIGGLPPGSGYDLAATGPELASSHRTGLAVEAGQVTEVTLVARRGGTVTGVVVAPGEDEGELLPVPDAHVAALPLGLRDLHFAPEILATTYDRTDASGAFVLEHAPPGEVDVVVWAPGYLPELSATLVVEEGARTHAGRLELEGGVVATGRVVDAAGEPIEGVTVRWDPSEALQDDLVRLTPFLAPALEQAPFPRTGADGSFRAGPLAGEPPYTVEFERAGYADESERWSPEDGALEVVLHRGGSVEGIVMDGERAVPVTAFSVTSDTRMAPPGEPGGDNPFSGGVPFESPTGRFRLDEIERGTTDLSVRAPGYAVATVRDVEVREGEVTRGVIVELFPGGRVSGFVTDAEGRPVAGARVVPVAEAGGSDGSSEDPQTVQVAMAIGSGVGDVNLAEGLGFFASVGTRTDDRGAFELEGVESGPRRVVAMHRDFVAGESEVFDVAGEPVVDWIEIELETGGGLYGTVRDPEGRPVPEALVLAMAPGGAMAGGSAGPRGGGVYQGVTDAEGAYRIEHMNPGSYFLAVTRGDEALTPLSFLGTLTFDLVSVPKGRFVQHDLVDTSAGACRVTGVVTADGEPARGGVLAALSQESETLFGIDFKAAPVDAHGRFEFPGLLPGEYQFSYDGPEADVRVAVEIPELPEHFVEVVLPDGSVRGVVVDAVSGQPVPNARVTLEQLGGLEPQGLLGGLFLRDSRSTSDSTGEDGAFLLERQPPGRYRLSVRGPRWGRNAGDWAPAEPVELELEDGEERTGLRLALEPTREIAGVVLDAEGAPLRGAEVWAVATGRAERAAAEARTGEDGTFRLRGLADGEYRVAADHEDYAGSRGQRTTLPSPDAESLEIRLTPGVEVELLVLDANGLGVAGAVGTLAPTEDGGTGEQRRRESALRGLFGDGEALSGPDGRVALGRHAPGEYTLEVWRSGRLARREVVTVDAGGTSRLRVTLD